MELSTITTEDFKDYFTRDFKYLPEYENDRIYFLGDVTALETSGGVVNFYTEQLASSQGVSPTTVTVPPTWSPANVDEDNYVLDTDIDKALAQALDNVNPSLFSDDDIMTDCFYYCAAHFLVMDIRAAEAGLDSRGEGVVSSKSVGSVSVSFTLPDTFAKDPFWNYFAQTAYGMKYLSYVIPKVNKIGIARGATKP